MKLWLSRIGVFLIVAVIVLAVSVFTFALTVAEPVSFSYGQTEISFIGKVEVAKNGKEYAEAKPKQKLSLNDKVKTSEKSSAEISFPDGSELRLDQNTEVILKTISADSSAKKIRILIKILAGRVWAQVATLVNQDSYFQVESDIAAAKATGTAFAFVMAEGKSDIYSMQHRTSVGSIKLENGKPKYFAQLAIEPGNHVVFDPANLPETIADIDPIKTGDDVLNSEWFKENRASIKNFDDKTKERLENRIKTASGISPRSRLYPLKLLGEQTRKTFIFTEQAQFDFERKLAERRLLEALKIAQEDKELSFKLANEFEENFLLLLSAAKGDNLLNLQNDLVSFQPLLTYYQDKLSEKKSEIIKMRVTELDELQKRLEKEKVGDIEALAEIIQDSSPELILEYSATPSWLKPENIQLYRKYIDFGDVRMFEGKPKAVTTPSPIGPIATPVPAMPTDTPVATFAQVDHIILEPIGDVVIPATITPRISAYDAAGNPLTVDAKNVTFTVSGSGDNSLNITVEGDYTVTATYQGKTSNSRSFHAFAPTPTNTPVPPPTTAPPPTTSP